MTVSRDKIVSFCSDYLKAENFQDYCHNGLQICGTDKVGKIVIGVTLSKRLIESAIQKKADMIIVHHGLFMKHFGEFPVIEGVWCERLKLLLNNDINLCGFHLPLDAHPLIGNNISIINALGLQKVCGLVEDGQSIGYVGAYKKAVDRDKFVELVNKKLETKSVVLSFGASQVKRVGIVSGGASPTWVTAQKLGCDTFITGDLRESVVRPAEEAKMNVINAGHYNSERFGIMNLGKLIQKKFKVPVEFVEIPCNI
ncbi:MAG: hypothetical protein UT32_C0010G0030 [Parcubacteria group bacterium GW2011_GWC2_39_14]|nr:MAG: hypothetical protein UT32_C0010G0030 [Parcubacteria group bacterium GW2011_GWC2_39_14]KKR55143.1 MAG: hypothetical protein UT91_C0004G0042 [Parcubacteria group bacterium GW2011_GWA2_40_23]